MTLQQLKYVTTVAQTGTISDAAKKLFISQPSLTKAVRELEKRWRLPSLNGQTAELSYPKRVRHFRICQTGSGAGGTAGGNL